MKPQLHESEREAPGQRNDDLAVERGVGRELLAERAQLGEVAQQRTAVAAPKTELASVVLEHPAEAIPLRLVPPVRSDGDVVDEQRLLRRGRDGRARRRARLVRRPAARGGGA